MLYHFLYPLSNEISAFNVFRYITFRSFGAALTAILLALALGPLFIRGLKRLQMGQVVRTDGPQTHLKKSGTPTMGGVLILFSMLVSTLLWADLSNPTLWIVMMVTAAYGLLGFVDDYQKVVKKNTKGLSARQKLLGQFIVAGLAAYLFMTYTPVNADLRVPFFKTFVLNLSWLYVPFCMCVIVGASNAVNLTDGLDGLAIGPVITTAGTFLILAYVAGHVKIAEYLEIPYIAGVGELAVYAAAMAAAGLGFLWFNTHPAQVFMGDVGSLSLGGGIGALAVATKNEFLLIIVGGIFVIEALSVMIQVASFKTRGKRVFRMAPIHHHFELKGWPEPKVIVRFWIISILLAIVALSTLKLR
ncbi:MAG: phospho-N-acetylmuramoyl-pentapeptide-transferase [Proteobacteria bacterium]|jgi:phospho-N-acetylmuramoyl-pentapeptide-transferase|nr:MAG: phospho-N-acetylmuramoyl-pentapeptide-transferase [Pseudomonadota bacterium]